MIREWFRRLDAQMDDFTILTLVAVTLLVVVGLAAITGTVLVVGYLVSTFPWVGGVLLTAAFGWLVVYTVRRVWRDGE